jgi:ribonuclease P protein component
MGVLLDQGIPSRERLRSPKLFKVAFDSGTSHHGVTLVAFVLINPSVPRQFGVIASRRVGGAVRRNRAKRLLREAYRKLRPQLVGQGFHLVLVARRACADASATQVQIELETLLKPLGLIET